MYFCDTHTHIQSKATGSRRDSDGAAKTDNVNTSQRSVRIATAEHPLPLPVPPNNTPTDGHEHQLDNTALDNAPGKNKYKKKKQQPKKLKQMPVGSANISGNNMQTEIKNRQTN